MRYAELFEDFVPDEEGLAAKGWYNARRKIWVDVPHGWHHTGFVWQNPESFDWDSVFDFSVDDYLKIYRNANLAIPTWDDLIIEPMKAAGWVRAGYNVSRKYAYFDAETLKFCQDALRYYAKRIVPKDNISFVIFDGEKPSDRLSVDEMLRIRFA